MKGAHPRSIFGIAIVVVLTSSIHAQKTAEDRTIETMFELGLSDSAIAYAARMQELSSDNPPLFARWTMRLMKCYSQAALRKPSIANPLWKQPDETYVQFQKSNPTAPRLPWLAWQQGRNHLLRAQASLAQYLAAPGNTDSREAALSEVRTIVSLMDELEDDIKQRQPIAAREVSGAKTQAPASDLERLRVDAGLMQCEALLIRSLLYPPGSADRINAATDVEARASEILSITGSDWDSRGPLQIALARSMLEVGRENEAVNALLTIAKRTAPSTTSQRAATVAIEHLTSRGDVRRAESLLNILKQSTTGPSYALAKMQIGLARLNASNSNRDAQLQALVDASKKIGGDFGGYWRNRAEALLRSAGAASSSSETSASTSIDLMLVEVRQLLLAEKKAEAISKLKQFLGDETASGRGANALRLSTQVGALLQLEKRWNEAAEAMEQTSLQFPSETNADKVHSQAVFARSQALREDIRNKDLVKQYENALIQQLRNWPSSAETNDARDRLGKWLKGQRRAKEFIAALWTRALSCAEPACTRTTSHEWLAELMLLNSSAERKELIDAANASLNSQPRDSRTAILRIATLVAKAFSDWPDPEEAKELASALATAGASISAEEDRQLLLAASILNAARSDDISLARRLASEWQPSSFPIAVQSALKPGFVDAVQQARRSSAKGWAETLKLNTLQTQQGDAVAEATRLKVKQWLGDSAALKELETLASISAKSAELQLQLAQALAYSASQKGKGGAELLQRSSKICRRLIASTKPNEQLHLSARLQFMRNLVAEGKKADAAKAAKLFLASQPIQSNIWQARFEEIAN